MALQKQAAPARNRVFVVVHIVSSVDSSLSALSTGADPLQEKMRVLAGGRRSVHLALLAIGGILLRTTSGEKDIHSGG